MASESSASPIAFLSTHFDRSTIDALEANLAAQVRDGKYDFENNLAILKVYQCCPDRINERHMTSMMIKALMNLPSNDFLLLSSVIPVLDPRIASTSAPVSQPFRLIELAAHLEKAEFRQFWKKVNEWKDLNLESVPGFRDSMQKYIMAVLQCAYRSVSRSILAASLNMEEGTPEVDMKIEEMKWKSDSNLVTFPANADNQTRTRKFKESIQFDQLSDVILRLTAAPEKYSK